MSELINDYLALSGTIFNSGWEAEGLRVVGRPAPPPSDTGELIVEVVRSDGKVAYHTYFTPEAVSFPDDPEPRYHFYYVGVPAYEDVSSITVKNEKTQEKVVEYVFEPDKEPSVQLIDTPSGILNGRFTITWEALSPADRDLTYTIQYSHDNGKPGTWSGGSSELNRTTYTIDWEDIRGSVTSSKIRVIASDGVNYDIDTSDSFIVPMKPPTLRLFAPLAPSPHYAQLGSKLQWAVNVDGVDGDHIPDEKITWHSSRDGTVGRGQSYRISNLSQGTHELWIEVTALDGLVHKENIGKITIVDKPPEIVVRVGDGSGPDLACNELELDVKFPQAGIKEIWYGFDMRKGDFKTTITSMEDLPITYQMERDLKLTVTAIDLADLFSNYDDVIPLKDCEEDAD